MLLTGLIGMTAASAGGENPDPEPVADHVTVAWLVPLTFEEWDALGRPTGGDQDLIIWPQTKIAHVETVGVDLNALDGLSLPACSVAQIDTYPLSAGLHERGGLDWTEDHGIVISWKFLWDANCAPPEPEPTPEPSPEPTPSPTPPAYDPEPEVTPTPAPEPEPTPVLPPAMAYEPFCVGDDLHVFVYTDGVLTDVEVYPAEAECIVEAHPAPEPPIDDTSTVDVPIPAKAGMGGLTDDEGGFNASALILSLLAVGMITGARRVTGRSR